MSIKAQVQGVANKVYQMGNRHVAGQHSLTNGEILCVGIAAVALFVPALWGKIPVAGKLTGATAAFIFMLIALILW